MQNTMYTSPAQAANSSPVASAEYPTLRPRSSEHYHPPGISYIAALTKFDAGVGEMLRQLLRSDAIFSGLVRRIEDERTNRIALAYNNYGVHP